MTVTRSESSVAVVRMEIQLDLQFLFQNKSDCQPFPLVQPLLYENYTEGSCLMQLITFDFSNMTMNAFSNMTIIGESLGKSIAWLMQIWLFIYLIFFAFGIQNYLL